MSTFFFSAAQFIEIENAILISSGIGIGIAYLPSAADALRARQVSRGDTLAFCIWLAWSDTAGERLISLIGRATHRDMDFYNSDLHAMLILGLVYSSGGHLFAPEVIDGRLPPRAWIGMGALTGLCVFLIVAVVLLNGF